MLQYLLYLSCCTLLVTGHSIDYFSTEEIPFQEESIFDVDPKPVFDFETPLHYPELIRDRRNAEVEATTLEVELEPTTLEPVVDMKVEQEQEQNATAPRDGTDACPVNAERGLTRLIRNARPLLPLDRLRNIIGHAVVDDAEVRELLKLLRNEKFREQVKILRATREDGILRDYICQALKLNHAYFLDYVRVFLNVNTNEPPTGPKPQSRRKGVRGLLQDLRDALPRRELRDLYRRQLASDNELSTAVRRIRSNEFRRLLSNVRALPEYRVVRYKLEGAGVPLQEVLNLVSNALGWGATDMGGETLIA